MIEIRRVLHISNKTEQKEHIDFLERFMLNLNAAIPGLENIKSTYQGDYTIQSKIDLFVDKIRYATNKIKLLIMKKNCDIPKKVINKG